MKKTLLLFAFCQGTITGNKIEGTAVWTNANGPQTHSFSGMAEGEK